MKCPFDFTLLWDTTEGYAVHCQSEEDANVFLHWVRKLFPQMCKMWPKDANHYGDHGKDTFYTFDVKIRDKWQKSRLMYGSMATVSRLGYKCIELEEIYKQEELIESDSSLDLLIG